MSDLKPCPCGQTPTELCLYDIAQGWKWVLASGNCCGEWHIEFRGNYSDPNDPEPELMELAIESWNEIRRKEIPVNIETWANTISTQVNETQQLINTLQESLGIQLCDHEWVDCTNEVIKSGEFCIKCKTIRGIT